MYGAFRQKGIIFCSCSGPGLPDELVVTAREVYIRFHGTKRWYRHDYTADELKVWVDRIHKAEPARVWAYFNNDREACAIWNARAFLRVLCQPSWQLRSFSLVQGGDNHAELTAMNVR